MSRVYLAGPIHGKTDDECRGWRNKAVRLLHPLSCFDPTLWDYRGKEAEHVDEIVERDKGVIHSSDFVLANALEPGWGTAMEVHFAYERSVPVVAFAPDNPSPWLLYHAARVCRTLEEACEWIRGQS